MTQLYFIIILFFLILIGFILPYLVSAQSDVAVLSGMLLMLLIIYLLIKGIEGLYLKMNGDKNEKTTGNS